MIIEFLGGIGVIIIILIIAKCLWNDFYKERWKKD